MSGELPERAVQRLLGDASPLLGGTDALRFGRYRLVRELGRGGMGVVWEAEDVELGRRVALKLLALAGPESAELREHLRREARAAARLSHPNIAAVYEAHDGAIAMQLVDGAPLSSRSIRDPRRLVAFVRDAARAVQHAHGQGVVHRDLKPHNLLVEGDRVLVTDFGLAKETAVDSPLSLSGRVLGTPAYLPPEQARGRSREVDARSDVYALGATLYDLLAGRPPFVDDDLVRLLRRVCEEDPRPIRAFAPGVSRDLATVIHRCLEKEKARRYATADELADDLTRWLEGRPVSARPPSLGYRAGKLVRRRPALVAASGVTVAALLVAGAVAWKSGVERRASALALGLSERVATVLADAAMHERLGEIEAAHARLDEGIAVSRAFLDRHDVPHARFLLGRLLRARGREAEALEAFDQAVAGDPSFAEARLQRALLLAARVRENAPDEARERALRELASIDLGAAGLQRVDAEHGGAELARLRGDLGAARRGFLEVRRLDPLHKEALLALSRLALAEGKGDEAWHLAMSALDLHRGFGPAYLARAAASERPAEDAPADAVEGIARRHALTAAERRVSGGDRSGLALQERGAARLHLADVEGALADFSAALQADPSDAAAHGNRGLVHARRAAGFAAAGRFEEAVESWDAAIADYASSVTIEPTLAGAFNNRGVCRTEKEWALERLGRTEDALRERAAALADFDAAAERDPRFLLARLNRAALRRRLAEDASRAGDRRAALGAIEGARGDADEILLARPDDAAALLERARLLDLDAHWRTVDGAIEEAGRLRDAARAGFEAAVGIDPSDGRARALLGFHRVRHGEDDAGAADLEAALALGPDPRMRERILAEIADLRRPR